MGTKTRFEKEAIANSEMAEISSNLPISETDWRCLQLQCEVLFLGLVLWKETSRVEKKKPDLFSAVSTRKQISCYSLYSLKKE